MYSETAEYMLMQQNLCWEFSWAWITIPELVPAASLYGHTLDPTRNPPQSQFGERKAI